MLKDLLNKILETFGILPNNSKRRFKGVPVDKTASKWHQVADAEQSGQIMYGALKEEMAGPVGRRVIELLLQSCKQTPLTSALSLKVIKYIQTEALRGRRAEAVSKDLQSILPEMTKKQLESICRTVMSKATTASDRVRSEELGLGWYRWETSQDGRVRPSHRKMQGVLIHWNNPPSPELLNGEDPVGVYHAGEADGCRCYPAPILGIDDLIKWPAKVYMDGKIVNMTRAQFRRVY